MKIDSKNSNLENNINVRITSLKYNLQICIKRKEQLIWKKKL